MQKVNQIFLNAKPKKKPCRRKKIREFNQTLLNMLSTRPCLKYF